MGTLYVVSTPIGNLADITIRAVKTLFSVDIILCEDTRRTGLLLQELKKRYGYVLQQFNPAERDFALLNNLTIRQLIRYDDHTEQKITHVLVEALMSGKSVALISDAGTPLISDPGYVLVREARKRGITVTSVPGPSALLAALTSSGFPADKFFFLGYPPEKQSNRRKLFFCLFQCFKVLKQNPTVIMYCAPHKLVRTLEDMKTVFGDTEIVINRELTKVHEEYWRGSIVQAIQHFADTKGEIVILWNQASNT